MKNTGIVKGVSNAFWKVCFQVKKHSPEILITAGVLGTVASAVMACKATPKACEVVNNCKKDVEELNNLIADEEKEDLEQFAIEDATKEIAVTYGKAGVELVKLYAPAVALGTLSIVSIVTSNSILRKRNIALAAAYATVNKTFGEYRSRVVDRFGKDVDRQLRFNIQSKEIEENVVDENGEVKTVKKTVEVCEIDQLSDYARVFDKLNDNWDDNPDANRFFLESQQNYANDLLRYRASHRVYLNEVYEMLGFEHTQAGQVLGWQLDPDNPDKDNYIDFGLKDNRESVRAFEDGYNPCVILDFNVDTDLRLGIAKV